VLNLAELDLAWDIADGNALKRNSALLVLLGLLLWESIAPCMPFFAGRGRERARHALRNLALGALNALCTAAALVVLWTAAAQWAAQHDFGVLNWLGLQGWWRGAAALVLFDLWMYWWHRFNHRVPGLWRLHRVHHCDPHMDVTIAHRFILAKYCCPRCCACRCWRCWA
jgi:sterol desaturase/sphingolipid hydroxylase (fatty acid hydroxylase superfamily)